jgi:hypothetical protein
LEGKKTEPNRTEPKLIGLNRFLVRFGSKTKKKKISLVVYFGPKPDQTENAQPYLKAVDLGPQELVNLQLLSSQIRACMAVYNILPKSRLGPSRPV